ncbi:hypothetical protein OZX67_03070 [Bifidobacterium sp. ESL0728]|uniref:hypothetical protein n=1 Tax=Bifidobacterium sp. ESL0728 TaxID=2983220 RepID=UPI0023F9E9C5|nr:hypothetical protein [Bifidobacterium sp. ESL0728]WEV59541.1 hypothetical protein OZX67_03070 [Bifidobacterium sp. ESL0728]
MNYTFSVFWIDDSEDWSKGESEELGNWLAAKGMELKPYFSNGHEPELNDFLAGKDGGKTSHFADVPELNDIDLILIDFNLLQGTWGTELISEIRKNRIYTNILLYSSQDLSKIDSEKNRNVPSEQKDLLKSPLGGVYYAKRDDKFSFFQNELHSVVQNLIKRSENIINLRGMVMENMSSFEEQFNDGILSCAQLLQPEHAVELDNLVEKALKRQTKRDKEEIEKWHNTGTSFFNNAINAQYGLSSSQKANILFCELPSLLEKYCNLDIGAIGKEANKAYRGELGEIRNKLGHVGSKDKTIILKGKSTPLDSDFHLRVRKDIQNFTSAFTKLMELIEDSKNSQTQPENT